MDAKDYESTEFYSYKFKNFSTMIIISVQYKFVCKQ